MAFFLIIWRGWHLPLIILSIIQSQLTELWPRVLESNLVKSNGSNLDFEMFIVPKVSSLVQFSVYAFLNRKLLWLRTTSGFNFSNSELG